MNIEELKKYIDLAEAKYRENPFLQKLVTTTAGAGIGAGVGSISLGKDSKGNKRGYLLGGEKKTSRSIGALAGALAGLHVPTLEKKSDFNMNFDWNAVKGQIDRAWEWYNKKATPETRALIGAGIGLGGGALAGSLFKRPISGAAVGALAGAGAGAYWKDLKKTIDAVSPIAADAGRKTVGKFKAYAKRVAQNAGKGTESEKAPGSAGDALAKGQEAAGV